MARIRALILLGVWISAIAIVSPVVVALGLATKKEKFIYDPLRFFVRLGARLAGVRVDVKGLQSLDPRQTYVFTPNHQSLVEVPLVLTFLGRNAAFLAKKELFSYPIFGHGMQAIGVVPVDREDRQGALKSAYTVVENLRKGKSYIVYPEGTRSPDGRLLPFKKGAFMMAIQAGVPVVPITVSGGAAVMPKGKIEVYPGKIRLIVHPPINTQDYSKETVGALVEKTKSAIMAGLTNRERAGLATSKSSGA
jgi:1-acyl-sn-glycerol-3-phosphate acyltransferase